MIHKRVASILAVVALLAVPSLAQPEPSTPVAGVTVEASFVSSTGWVKPGEAYPFKVIVRGGKTTAQGLKLTVTLPASAQFVSSSVAPAAMSANAATFNLAAVAPNTTTRIVLQARAATLAQDPEIMWKDLSATASLTQGIAAVVGTSVSHGPRVTTLETARFGDRPFPILMAEYQDIKHCTGEGEPYDECTGNHTPEAFTESVNSKASGTSVWRLYQDISLGQLHPQGAVPTAGKGTVAFDGLGGRRWSQPSPKGTCAGVTVAGLDGSPAYANRIEDGWYVLPGTQAYYGSDRVGHSLGASLTGVGALGGIDSACGPTGKFVYDAALAADPDLDYNDFDTDRDGVVDFMMVIFAGDGGNGSTTTTGLKNIWPHSSDLRSYFTDANGQTGYVSDDQLRDELERPLWFTDDTRIKTTTKNTGDELKALVRVGPYNVNPEPSQEKISVIAHEYGHSLGLPDFYSTGGRSTFGTWELMASDHAQFNTSFSRQDLGWVVPREAADGEYALRESKNDTHEIHWKRPDGTPYVLKGPSVHNADVLRVGVPTTPVIEEVPSGTHAWHSGSGNDFDCPTVGGRGMLVQVPEAAQVADASSMTLTFQSFYEIEWDFDYGFVLASGDGGATWKSLPSQQGTTLSKAYNPNESACMEKWDNALTGTSGDLSSPANPNRALVKYAEPVWVEDSFDLSEFAGADDLLLLFSYATDAGLAKRGWFVDDISITADVGGSQRALYASDFEKSLESTRLFAMGQGGWARITSGGGTDQDHAYYVELRDRVGWDFDSKDQSDRGPVTWEPGVSMIYTNEQHGYGNTGVSDPPAQTPVDSVPVPLSATPNLDDAAFTVAPGRQLFDGCTHRDNYSDPAGPDGQWKLPGQMRLFVESIEGISKTGKAPSAAVATVKVDVKPDCKSPPPAAPTVAFGAGRSDPDPDGAYQLKWTRPKGAVGPDIVQETRGLATLLGDGAEEGLSNWTLSKSGVGALDWETTTVKVHEGSNAFVSRHPDGATNVEATLELTTPIKVPAGVESTLTWYDWLAAEGDDAVFVDVHDGRDWANVYQASRPLGADGAAPGLIEEPFNFHSISLTRYAGKSIKLRFRFAAGPDNRATSSSVFGWYVDDIAIKTAAWRDIATTTGTSIARANLPDGEYFYRVRTAFPFGSGATIPGPWSEFVGTKVQGSKATAYPPAGEAAPTKPPTSVGGVRNRAPLPATGVGSGALGAALLLLAFAAAAVTRRATRT